MPYCGKCDKDIAYCCCPDIDERMKRVAFSKDGVVAMKWCRKCDKHYARCRCEPPDFYIVRAGKDITQPYYKTIEGSIIAPDLNKR